MQVPACSAAQLSAAQVHVEVGAVVLSVLCHATGARVAATSIIAVSRAARARMRLFVSRKRYRQYAIYRRYFSMETVMPDSAPILLDRHLQRRLTEKHAELERYRPLAPHVIERLHGDLRIELT